MRYLMIILAITAMVSCTKSESDNAPEKAASKMATKADDNTLATVADAQKFIDSVNTDLAELGHRLALASWARQTNITEETIAKAAELNAEYLAFSSRIAEQSKRFNHLELQGELGRAMNLIRIQNVMPAPADKTKSDELAQIAVDMDSTYGKGKYCRTEKDCLNLGDLENILATSRNYDELLEAWVGWRTISKAMRGPYQRFVELTKEGAAELGYDNLGALWKSGYDMDPIEFEKVSEKLWEQVQPLYEQLHCHVRAKLAEEYGADKVPLDQPIPAHLLGNMWSQSWANIYPLMEPYSGEANLDVTAALVEQEYDAVRMVKLAEDFFTSLGMPKLPDSFYKLSMFTKPDGREVVCHASAWPIDGKEDVRIKMCMEPESEDLYTIYHELGHIYYFLIYKNQPPLFQNGGHDGFHEAIGDTVVLSMTPDYLESIGLASDVEPNDRALINQQMLTALDKIAFLPFGKLVDQWRWDVFSGKTTPATYNADWWKQRTKYQGIQSPVPRTESDFDPGAKYHVPGNTPYTRYFLSFILQFQFHKALCAEAGHVGPLHECSIYDSRKAGEKFSKMMAMGQSRPWQDALQQLTGKREMDASAIIEYFTPLMGYLQEQNKGRSCGW